MKNTSRLLSRLAVCSVCALPVACDVSSSRVDNAAATTQDIEAVELKKIDEIATLESDEGGNVVRVSILGNTIKGVDLSELKQYADIQEVSLQECSWLTDDDLKHVAALSELKTLKLIRVPITDDALAHLKGITSLRQLQLAHTNVKGAGLGHLKSLGLQRLEIHGAATVGQELAALGDLQGLTELVVNCPSVRLADLQPVAAISQLEFLDVTNCTVTAEGIVGLNGLTELQLFRCDSKVLTDAMLEKLCHFPRLKELDLHESKVSDDGLRHVVSLANLERLNLYKCKVTGSGLAQLANSKNLKSVHIWRGQIGRGSPVVVEELMKALPDCEVVVSTL